MTPITDIVRRYAEGEIPFNTAREEMRKLTAQPVGGTDRMFGGFAADDDYEVEGSVMEVHLAGILYDLNADEVELLVKSLVGQSFEPESSPTREAETAGGDSVPPTDEGEDEEDGIDYSSDEPPTLQQLLGTAEDPAFHNPATEEEGELEEEAKVTKHGGGSHDDEEHGNWADRIGRAIDAARGKLFGDDEGASGEVSQEEAPRAPEPEAPSLPEQQAPDPGPTELSSDTGSEQADISGAEGARRISRPTSLSDLIGQDKTRQRLKVIADSARERNAPLPHVMFAGPPGLGKTTMAKALANDFGADIKTVTGSSIGGPEEMATLLAGLEPNSVLFIDEIHALDRDTQEMLFPAMEDFEADLEFGGRQARVELPPFTLIGATTNPEGLVRPLRDRFGVTESLDYYEPDELGTLAKSTATKLGFEMDEATATTIGERGRGTPRLTNHLVSRAADYAIANDLPLNLDTANRALALWDIDQRGLTPQDRSVLRALDSFDRPVSATSVADTMGMDTDFIERDIEPWLMRQGLMQRTRGGRIITEAGRQHLAEAEEFLNSFEFSKADTFSAPVTIAKKDKRKNLVFGWANVSHVDGSQITDRQNHMIDIDDLEDAAYNFVVKGYATGEMHRSDPLGELVESVVITQDKIDAGAFPQNRLGHWWVGFRVPDETWERVQKGEWQMFSIEGKARLTPSD